MAGKAKGEEILFALFDCADAFLEQQETCFFLCSEGVCNPRPKPGDFKSPLNSGKVPSSINGKRASSYAPRGFVTPGQSPEISNLL
jgi:hypothetical protein